MCQDNDRLEEDKIERSQLPHDSFLSYFIYQMKFAENLCRCLIKIFLEILDMSIRNFRTHLKNHETFKNFKDSRKIACFEKQESKFLFGNLIKAETYKNLKKVIKIIFCSFAFS